MDLPATRALASACPKYPVFDGAHFEGHEHDRSRGPSQNPQASCLRRGEVCGANRRSKDCLRPSQCWEKSAWNAVGLLCLVLSVSVMARVPHDLDGLQREARIAKNVFESALRTVWQDDLRMSSVKTEHLANQGMLFSVRGSKPWVPIRDRGGKKIVIEEQMALIGELNRREQIQTENEDTQNIESAIANVVCDYGGQ